MTDSSSPIGKAFEVTEQAGEQATPTKNLAKGIDDEAESEMLLAPNQAALIQELEAQVHIAGTLVLAGSFKDKCTEVMQDLVSIAQANLAILRVVDEERQGLLMFAAGGPGHVDRKMAARFDRVSVSEYQPSSAKTRA